MLRHEHRHDTVGIRICGTKNDLSVRVQPRTVALADGGGRLHLRQTASNGTANAPDDNHLTAALKWAGEAQHAEAEAGS